MWGTKNNWDHRPRAATAAQSGIASPVVCTIYDILPASIRPQSLAFREYEHDPGIAVESLDCQELQQERSAKHVRLVSSILSAFYGRKGVG